jgi:carbamoyltransferase|tara:strand:+ start:603 stop:1574 length:972 start_codon:yes stop_codon:yes gene_type:complete
MIIWGMVGNSHDASLAVFENNNLVWASLAKDFTGLPNNPDFAEEQLKEAILLFGHPFKVVWYERPFLKTLRQWRAGQGWLGKENDIRKYLKRWDINCKIEYTQHHLSHAAYAYYTQPHDDCAVICLDSIGEFESLTIWHGKNNKLEKIHSQGYPHSLGLFYSAMTQRMGLVPQRDEYLVAQWAKQGNSKRMSHLLRKEIIDVDHTRGDPQSIKMRENLHRGCMWWRPELTTQQDMFDLAAATQAVFEYCVNVLSIWAVAETGSKNVALAGGGALNKDAIEKIQPHWKNVWVPPNPGDPGSCIGAVLAKTKQNTLIEHAWRKEK